MATVQSGDTLSAIARSYGLSVLDLISANPQLANPNLIHPGQEINIPEGPVSQAERNAAGNFLMASPSVQQVQTAAGQITASQGIYPTLAQANYAAAQASAPVVAGINTPTDRVLGQQGTAAEIAQEKSLRARQPAAAMRRPAASVTTRRPSAATGRVPRAVGAGLALSPEQMALAERYVSAGYPQDVAADMARNNRSIEGGGSILPAFKEGVQNAYNLVGLWYNLNQSIPSELRTLEFQLRQQGLSDAEMQATLAARELELRTELYSRYTVTVDKGGVESAEGTGAAETERIIEQAVVTAGGQPRDEAGMQTATVAGKAMYPFVSPDVLALRQQSWDRNIGVAAAVILSDTQRTNENVTVYADALKFIADVINNQPEALRVVSLMTPDQLAQFAQLLQSNNAAAMQYASLLEGKTREQIIAIAKQELTDIGYANYPSASNLYRTGDPGQLSQTIEDLIFGGGGGGFAGTGGGFGGGDGGGGGDGPRALGFASLSAGLYNWRI